MINPNTGEPLPKISGIVYLSSTLIAAFNDAKYDLLEYNRLGGPWCAPREVEREFIMSAMLLVDALDNAEKEEDLVDE